jgi:hypothetical protein
MIETFLVHYNMFGLTNIHGKYHHSNHLIMYHVQSSPHINNYKKIDELFYMHVINNL